MKIRSMRLFIMLTIVSFLFAGALFQYITADRKNLTNAVMVTAEVK